MLITHLPFNISPKLAYTLVSLIVSYLLTHYAITLDPDIALMISTGIASAVGYRSPAGEQLPGIVGPGSDAGLSVEAAQHIEKS